MTKRLLILSSWRFFTRHPWQLWLTLLSIALGTAVIIAVDLANQSAALSFQRSVQTLSGEMTHELTATQGNLPDEFYRQLRVDWGYRDTSPQVEVTLSWQGQAYTLLGIDPFAAAMPAGPGNAVSPDALRGLLTTPQSILVPLPLAQRLGVGSGQTLELRQGTQTVVLKVLATPVLPAASGLLLTDIATAQAIMSATSGQTGLSRIRLKLSDAQADALQARLPAGIRLESFASRQQTFNQMTQAFSTNLLAMSLLAMLVGAFLVYNTMTFSVLQRRQSFAIGRMLGLTGGQLFRHLLLEALVLGVLGSVLGVLLGVLLGQGLLVLVTRTISDLFIHVQPGDLHMASWQVLKGVGITLLAVLVATLNPALEAARIAPVQVQRRSHLEQQHDQRGKWLALAGLGLMCCAPLLIGVSEKSLLAGFSGLFVLILGYGLVVPLVLRTSLHWLGAWPVLRQRLLSRMAVRSIEASLSRTALAIIALSVAVSATVGVSIMITSFRSSVADWLDMTLSSDLYISASSGELTRTDAGLHPDWLQRVQTLPGIASISNGRMLKLELDGFPVPVLVLEPGSHSRKGFEFLGGDPALIWQRFVAGDGVLISEPFAWHHDKQPGDTVTLYSERDGPIRLPVLGIFRDYSATQGMATLSRVLYDRHWADPLRSSIGLKLLDEVDPGSVLARLEAWAVELQQDDSLLTIRSNRDIREHSLQIFDRTFAVTHVLRVLVIIVAFVGVFSALMALFLEKGREFAILRATGFTPQQLRQLVTIQALLIGLLAGLLALPLGWLLSGILIDIINQRSFGWTMHTRFLPLVLLQALVLAVVAALLASLYPVRRIGLLTVGAGLRNG